MVSVSRYSRREARTSARVSSCPSASMALDANEVYRKGKRCEISRYREITTNGRAWGFSSVFWVFQYCSRSPVELSCGNSGELGPQRTYKPHTTHKKEK